MSSLPAVRPSHPGDNLPVIGTPDQWSRDFAIIGGLIGALAPAVLWTWPALGVAMSVLGGLFGAVSGPTFGRMIRQQADSLRGRLPIPAMLLYLPLLGSAWGGATAGVAGALTAGGMSLVVGEPSMAMAAVLYGGLTSAVVGAMVGAAVVGLLWFPYAFLSVMRQRRWPVFAATALIAPVAAPVLAMLLGAL